MSDSEEASRRALLKYYNSQTMTHGGYIIAVVIGFLTLISQWKAFAGNFIILCVFFFIVSSLVGLGISLVGRTMWWGYLSDGVLRVKFGEKSEKTLIDWLYEWGKQKRINTELNHFFLEDKLLDELSEKLIEHANVDVLVTNPFVERCHLSNTLISAIAKGTRVRLVTRSPTSEKYYQKKKQKYHSKLKEKGVSITYDDSVHAKLIVADRAVATVSSMNFVASSSGGASYEAGLVTVEPNVVQSVARSIINRL